MKQIQERAEKLRQSKLKNAKSEEQKSAIVVVTSKPPDNNDNDSVGGESIASSQGSVERFQLETCTKLIYMTVTGEPTEVQLGRRVANYTELQCEIARYFPKSDKMFKIQDAEGNTLVTTELRSHEILRVKEILTKPDFKMLNRLGTRWETTEYHSEQLNWTLPPDVDSATISAALAAGGNGARETHGGGEDMNDDGY